MKDPGDRRRLAEAEAVVARQRVTRTLSVLRTRLKLRRLMHDAAEEVGERSSAAARAGIDGARRYPGLIAGVAAIGAAILARRGVMGFFRRRRGETGRGGKS